MRARTWSLAALAALLGWRTARRLTLPRLEGRVAVVSGGSRGLGFLLARELLRQGCRVVICARDTAELARAEQQLLRYGTVLALTCDVTDPEQVAALMTDTASRLGEVDILVNNAGVIQVGPVEAMTLADFEEAMAVNFWGPLNLIWSVLPRMRERRAGQIVNITSIGARLPVPHLLPYDCAKAAFASLSDGLHVELHRQGISVTTVIPGLMRTGSPLNAQFKGDAAREFRWFSAGDELRLSSMSAERAARRIVLALRRREMQVVLTWQARLGRLAAGLFPRLTVLLARLANRLLPASTGSRFHTTQGREVLGGLRSRRLRSRLASNASQTNEL